MSERGNTTHDQERDDELRRETQGLVQGNANGGHVEERRQTEALPDDTDSPEVSDALGVVGVPTDADSPLMDDPASPTDDDDTLTEGAAALTADPIVASSRTEDRP